MIIICINNFGYPLSLELNKQYYFVSEKENHYIILDENLEECEFPKDLFVKK
jgi:hypothetical protein